MHVPHYSPSILQRLALLFVFVAVGASAASLIDNLTGLPLYPNLNDGAMDRFLLVEVLGHQCARFVGRTSDSLEAVESWYRKALPRAGESDLGKDPLFGGYPNLVGIKLVVGFDYVAIYTTSSRPSSVTFELHRCTWSN